MNAELEAIKALWDSTRDGGRDDAGTRALCDAYVAAHPELFTELSAMTV